MTKQPSVLGGACIIASVCVGAGMLGLPSAGAGAWTFGAAFIMLFTMIMMTLSGFMLLEAYRSFEIHVSFDTVTHQTLGYKINFLNNLAVYFVGGILLYAYITTLGEIFGQMIGLHNKLSSILTTGIFGLIVWHSTRAVDRISVLLIIFMVITFVLSISGLAANINLDVLFNSANKDATYTPYLIGLMPVALTSFGYHHSVASMRAYYGNERQASYAILGGTSIALVLYLVWIVSIFGNLPRTEFAPVIAEGGNVESLMKALGDIVSSSTVQNSIKAFTVAAILSSFIGVGLGVFDYLADLFKFNDSKIGRTKSALVTFIPPLTLSVYAPFGFVTVIGYAGAIATIWTCIIPALLVYKIRQKRVNNAGFTVCGGNFSIAILLIYGVLVAAFHFLNMVNALPIFIG